MSEEQEMMEPSDQDAYAQGSATKRKIMQAIQTLNVKYADMLMRLSDMEDKAKDVKTMAEAEQKNIASLVSNLACQAETLTRKVGDWKEVVSGLTSAFLHNQSIIQMIADASREGKLRWREKLAETRRLADMAIAIEDAVPNVSANAAHEEQNTAYPQE